MENSTANFCKTLSFIVGLVGIVLSLFSISLKRSSTLSFILSLLGYLIICTILFALGEIIDLLEKVLLKIRLKETGPSNRKITNRSGVFSSFDTWTCYTCKSKNSASSLYCKDCGTFR